MGVLVNLLVNALAVFIAAKILPGVIIDNLWTAVTVAVVLGIINTFIKPVLIILTLPLNILTLGLFTFVINSFIVLLVSTIVPGFNVRNFWWAFLFSLTISLVSWFLQNLTRE